MEAAFRAWVAEVGGGMVDPGAPLGAASVVSSTGISDSAAAPIQGYSLFRADNLDAAIRLVQSHPFVARGGSLQVSEAMDLGG
jgi:hypothetical protein